MMTQSVFWKTHPSLIKRMSKNGRSTGGFTFFKKPAPPSASPRRKRVLVLEESAVKKSKLSLGQGQISFCETMTTQTIFDLK